MRRLLAKYESMPLPAKAAFWFAVCSAVQSGAAFLAIPILTRMMSQEQYGIVTLYNSWRQIVAIFATLNIYCGVFNVGMAKWKESRDAYLSSMIGLTAVLVAACYLIYRLAEPLLGAVIQLPSEFMGVMMIQIFATTVFSLWSARERFEYRYHALLGMTAIYAIVGQAASIVAVQLTPEDSCKAFASVVSLSVVLLAVAILLAARVLRRNHKLFDRVFWRHAVSFNLPLVPHYLATLILGQADRIMIASINGAADAAVYGVAYTVGLMIQIVTGAITNALTPWMYGRLEVRDAHGFSERIEKIVLCVGLANTLVIFAAPEIMAIAGPESYRLGMYVIPPVAAAMLATFVYGLFAQVEFYYEKKAGVVVASTAAAVVNIVLNFLALPVFGYWAAGYTTLLCYGLLAWGHYLYMNHVLEAKGLRGLFDGKKILACCLAFAPVSALGMVLYDFPLARLCLVVGVAALAIWQRKRIAGLLSAVKGHDA